MEQVVIAGLGPHYLCKGGVKELEGIWGIWSAKGCERLGSSHGVWKVVILTGNKIFRVKHVLVNYFLKINYGSLDIFWARNPISFQHTLLTSCPFLKPFTTSRGIWILHLHMRWLIDRIGSAHSHFPHNFWSIHMNI